MAKMFYSIDEAAQRLGKSADEVKKMASSGQLQEFRDRDKLMFKREQVDLIAGDAGGGGEGGGVEIPLADSKGGSGMGGSGLGGSGAGGSSLTLALEDEPDGAPKAGAPKAAKSGSGVGIEIDDPAQRSGISIFEAADADTGESDPLAATQITSGRKGEGEAEGGELTAMEAGGSGSGLLELTREADDTSLGADLLEDVYKGDEEGGGGGGPTETQGASGLFESTNAPSDVSTPTMPAMAMVAVEPYDGIWSGISGGLAFGALVVGGIALFAVLTGLLDAGDNGLVRMFSANLMPVLGGMFAFIALAGAVGWFLGRRT